MRKGKQAVQDRPFQVAYRGYLITYNSIHDTFYVSKDGFHVGSAYSRAAACDMINEVVGPFPKEGGES